MAGKGGAWKVAYADFVTAMMAFFLVMWLISQDQKIKESIARYFMDPVGLRLSGTSTTPTSAGGLMEADVVGSVPGSRLRTAGRGVGEAQDPTEPDNETGIVSEWLFDDPDWSRRWQPLAREQLAAAREYHPRDAGPEHDAPADEFATRQLAVRLQQLLRDDGAAQTSGVHRELLLRAVSRVDWESVAAECLWEAENGPRESTGMGAP